MYHNSNVVHTGGSSTYVARDSIIHNHGPRSGFERLENHVAADALHNSGEVSDQPKCHPGTRVAILDHLIAWAAVLTYTYPIIWLHGPAGTGKSAILRTIAQMLFDQQLLLASFFFFRTAASRNSSGKFVATIAYQVAVAIPATRLHIEQAIERNPLLFSLSLWDQAHALIVSPILAVHNDPSFDASQHPRILVIDGLDECHDPDKQCEILQVLCRIIQKLSIPFAVLVASRPEHHIRAAFDLGDLNRLSSRLALDNAYKPDRDIKNHLTDKFSAIRANHPLKSSLPASPWPSQGVIDKLVAKASGQFIYSSTVDKFISSPKHNPAKRLDMILGALDAGTSKPFEQLDILYSIIFLSNDLIDLAGTLRILGVLLVPLKSGVYLSPAFLEYLLELEPGDVRRLLFGLESLLTVGRHDENIHFFHVSLSDYLFDKSRSGQFWVDAGMAYADLAQQCLVRLLKWTEWTGIHIDSRIFFWSNYEIFCKATPTPGLHKAIQDFDLTKVLDQYMDVHRLLLKAIRNSNFSDAEQLYHSQFTVYARIVEPKIQVYFQDIPLKYFFVASIILDKDFTLDHGCNMKHIFRLSPEMVDRDEKHGFELLSESIFSPRLPWALNDILHDLGGKYAVDDNDYADIALYLMKCITQDSGYDLPIRIRVTVKPTMAEMFLKILPKSSIRHDLIEYTKTQSLSQAYPRDSRIRRAITDYLSRAEAYNNGSREILKSEPQPSRSTTPPVLNQVHTTRMVAHGLDTNKACKKRGQISLNLEPQSSKLNRRKRR